MRAAPSVQESGNRYLAKNKAHRFFLVMSAKLLYVVKDQSEGEVMSILGIEKTSDPDPAIRKP